MTKQPKSDGPEVKPAFLGGHTMRVEIDLEITLTQNLNGALWIVLQDIIINRSDPTEKVQ